MAVPFSLGSFVHHAPQVNFAQSIPVKSPKTLKNIPVSARLMLLLSRAIFSDVRKPIAFPKLAAIIATIANHMLTW